MGKIFNKPMAPNDPNRVPKEHRDFINKMYGGLRSEGMNLFEAQTVTQALSVLRNLPKDKFIIAGQMLADLTKEVASMKEGNTLLEADLQILGYKMTESLNELSLESLDFKL